MKRIRELKNSLTNNSVINTLIVGYCFIVLIYQVLYLLVPFRQLIQFLHLDFISSGLAVLGLFAFAWDVIIDRVFLKTRFSYFLFALIGIMVISSLLTIQYGVVDNVKNIIWQSVQMLVIFPLYKRIPSNRCSSLHYTLYWTFTAVFIPANLISLYQFFFNIGYTVSFTKGDSRQGLLEGRLYGVYSSPHFISVILLCLAITSIFFLLKTKKAWLKIIYALLAFSHVTQVVLSSTRSVIVGMACAVAFTAFVYFYKYATIRYNKTAFVRTVISVIGALCSLVLVVGIFSLVKGMGTSALRSFTQLRQETVLNQDSGSNSIESVETEDTSNTIVSTTPTFSESLVERDDTKKDDISNNRFKIWSDHLTVVVETPLSLLFGNSPGNYMAHIKSSFPNLYIVQYIKENYPLMYENDLIYDVHNAYLGAFATTGLLGVLFLLAFLICGLVKILRFVFKRRGIARETLYLLCMLVFILVSSFFDSDLFFKCTSTSVLFWLLCGMLLKTTEQSEQEFSEN